MLIFNPALVVSWVASSIESPSKDGALTLEPGPTVMYQSHPPNAIATKAKMARLRRVLLFLRFLVLEFFVAVEADDFFAAGALITFSLTGAVGVEATGGAV